MGYRENNIVHQNGDFWVLRDAFGHAFTVMRAGITHSVSDSTYADQSLAIARADYLASRAVVPATEQTLTCVGMGPDCAEAVTHIDGDGYTYCATHGVRRRQYCKCRKLTPGERKRLTRGETIRY